MKILGISNPHFLGVSVATRAICNDWIPAEATTTNYGQQSIASDILRKQPDILVVGGWSQGYYEILSLVKKGGRDFPVLAVSHSTPFHGSFFHTDWVKPEFEVAFEDGIVDLMGFVHPQTAEYYQKIRKTFAVFVPHSFKPEHRSPKSDRFRIGILGTPAWYKNVEGAVIVARDFVKNHPDAEIVTSTGVNKTHSVFLTTLRSCSVLIHLSHLECYSNTVQEAWARGIPVITSPASEGLMHCNPLLPFHCGVEFNGLCLDSAINPLALYRALEMVKGRWEPISRSVHEMSNFLHTQTRTYLHAVFQRIINDYPRREHDVGFFESPFTAEGIPWDEIRSKA